jgi:hypothetical protein
MPKTSKPAKSIYHIEYDTTYGDFIIGHIYYWAKFGLSTDTEYIYDSRVSGWAHSVKGAHRKINRAYKRWQKKHPKKFEIDGVL